MKYKNNILLATKERSFLRFDAMQLLQFTDNQTQDTAPANKSSWNVWDNNEPGLGVVKPFKLAIG